MYVSKHIKEREFRGVVAMLCLPWWAFLPDVTSLTLLLTIICPIKIQLSQFLSIKACRIKMKKEVSISYSYNFFNRVLDFRERALGCSPTSSAFKQIVKKCSRRVVQLREVQRV